MTQPNAFLHERDDIRDLYRALSLELKISPQLIEKDYWLMHCLWGLSAQSFALELKGGTSLSKGWGIIDRFSEDVDIKLLKPSDSPLPIGKNQDKSSQIQARANYFNQLASTISIPGIRSVTRDHAFDDAKMRGGGIRLIYDSVFETLPGVKEGILLEVGFDITTPNSPRTISSWMVEKAFQAGFSVRDNRALQVSCYLPEYTFVEKLQTISTKYRSYQERKIMPVNFLRHYYDVFKLLEHDRVQRFIGSPEYLEHKRKRFRTGDEMNLVRNEAFILSEPTIRKVFKAEYEKTQPLYSKGQPEFDDILERMRGYLEAL